MMKVEKIVVFVKKKSIIVKLSCRSVTRLGVVYVMMSHDTSFHITIENDETQHKTP